MPDDDEVEWDDVSFGLASETRFLIMLELRQQERTPTQLAERTEKNPSHVSRGLSELADRDLVRCLTPDASKGRIYALTSKGERVLDEVKRLVSDG